jgi:hypothetical protein
MDYINQNIKNIRISKLLVTLLIVFASQSFANPAQEKLGKAQGYFLLGVYLEADSAAIVIKKVGTGGTRPVEWSLNNQDKWLLKSLPQGTYQIQEVKAPYFNLPYRKDTAKDPLWRFEIEAGKINYAGKLEIEKKRTTNYVEIKRLNRIVTDHHDILKSFPELLNLYPLVNGMAIRDDYALDYIQGTK